MLVTFLIELYVSPGVTDPFRYISDSHVGVWTQPARDVRTGTEETQTEGQGTWTSWTESLRTES